ncbi:SURP and G-patch domain-containing protein 1-like isoform X1 [Branchiostoma floridae x Branchiostoma belcheri]
MAHRGSYGGGGQGQYPAGQPGYSGGYQQATQDRMSRAQSLSQQERLIELKKKEIEKRMAEQKKKEEEERLKKLAKLKGKALSSQAAPPPVQVSPGPSSVVNKFVNDGSFMEQFMRMQKKKTVKREEDKSQGVEPENGTPAADVSAPQTAAAAAAKLAFSGKKATPSSITNFVSHMKRTDKSATSISRPDVFETPEREPEQPRKTISVSPPEDLQTREVVEKLAAFVAEGGKQVEEVAIKKNKDNPAFWFLYEPNSRAYKYYRQKVQELEGKSRRDLDGDDADTEGEGGDTARGIKRKRKSRWGPQESVGSVPPPSVVNIPAPGVVQPAMPGVSAPGLVGMPQMSAAQQQSGSGLGGTGTSAGPAKQWPGRRTEGSQMSTAQFVQHLEDYIQWSQSQNVSAGATAAASISGVNPVGLRGTSELSSEQLKQLKEQKEMQMMYNMITSKRKKAAENAAKGKFKYEYDSDEETEGGTWEHRRRAQEMDNTAEWADKLTSMNKGKHFIGDFLPPEELEKFMEKFKALKEGRDPDLSDYAEFKLGEDNLGYKMLQAMGWTEGKGLGANEEGITAPVNKGQQAIENAGLGVDKPSELSKEDDEYEAFRKRMMLAYRFRPNPLNNPRRPYY